MIRDTVHAILKRWGDTRRKQSIWNQEYSSSRWIRPDNQTEGVPARRDSVLEVIERYSANAEILELGCGAGETAFEIAVAYQRYVGVDISDIAIRQAIDGAKRHPTREGKISFTVGDISTFVPDGTFSVILFRESIYYIPQIKISGTLRRLASFLTPKGIFIVRVHDRLKYKPILELIERDYSIVDRCFPENSGTATLVFSPR
jgi:SAM-dependent methyltransferase